MGLISPSKGTTGPAKIMVHQMKGNPGGNQQSVSGNTGGRLVFTQGANNSISLPQGAILLKSPTSASAKLAPNSQQVSVIIYFRSF